MWHHEQPYDCLFLLCEYPIADCTLVVGLHHQCLWGMDIITVNRAIESDEAVSLASSDYIRLEFNEATT
jgi:hypothetical protein